MTRIKELIEVAALTALAFVVTLMSFGFLVLLALLPFAIIGAGAALVVWIVRQVM